MSDEAPYADHVAAPGPAAYPGADPQARTPIGVLRRLLDGNRRFFSGAPRHGYDVTQARRRAEQPKPLALVIGCIDSRVPPEAVFDQGFAELLSVRTAGHVLDRATVASVELAVRKLRVPLIVVLGHEACAAVEYAVDATHRGERPGPELSFLVDQIAPSVPLDPALSGSQTYEGAVRGHIAATVSAVRALPTVAEAVAAGELAVVGVRYGVTYGRAQLVVAPEPGPDTTMPPGQRPGASSGL
ncbi:MAG: carbonic anhydrase [Micromonosporaceae bacterium]